MDGKTTKVSIPFNQGGKSYNPPAGNVSHMAGDVSIPFNQGGKSYEVVKPLGHARLRYVSIPFNQGGKSYRPCKFRRKDFAGDSLNPF